MESSNQPQQKQNLEFHHKIDSQQKEQWEKIQNEIRALIVEYDDFDWNLQTLKLVGGLDISFSVQDPSVAISYITVLEYPSLKVLYEDWEQVHVDIPYCPGFLAFRELPFCLKLIEKLKQKNIDLMPQCILLDGNGILHPKKCGLASHLGVVLNIPTIGCSKNVFDIDGIQKSNFKELCDKNLQNSGDFVNIVGKSGQIWGAALINGKSKNPLIISIGTKICLQTAVKIVLSCSIHRIAEPIRIADLSSRKILSSMYEKQNDFKNVI